MSAYEQLLDVLASRGQKVRRNGSGASVQCPAHDDRTASLSVRPGREGVLVHCHAGCEVQDVLKPLGWEPRHLFDRQLDKAARTPATAPREVAAYTYVDEQGTPLFVAVRLSPKGFRQYALNPDGTRQRGLGDARRVLYHLDRLHEWPRRGAARLVVVEGEKDADRLQGELDRRWPDTSVVTTSPGGAGKWSKVDEDARDAAATLFERVMVIADNDDAGIAHAREVAADLRARNPALEVAVKRVDGPPKCDVSDLLDAGVDVETMLRRLVPLDEDETPYRRLRVRSAADIRPKRVRWLWEGRHAMGSLDLLAGREGRGKSLLAVWKAARVTRGDLPGEFHGTPRNVVIVATEDSWAHTIVPRLMAADADLERVLHVESVTEDERVMPLSLPSDLDEFERVLRDYEVALVILDPLMSRLDRKLDTHRDAEVRLALEPLVEIAGTSGSAVTGLIHLNKAASADPLDRVMASKAFTAVARAVSIVLDDDTDEDGRRRLLGTPKNNLGRTDLPLHQFTVVGHQFVADDEVIETARIEWGGHDTRTARDVLADEHRDPDEKSAVADCVEWLQGHLSEHDHRVESAYIKQEALGKKYSVATLQRARKRTSIRTFSYGSPRRTDWYDPDHWHKVDNGLVKSSRVTDSASSRVRSPGEREQLT